MSDATQKNKNLVITLQPTEELVEPVSSGKALSFALEEGKDNKYARFTLAALSSIPWIGSLLGAAASLGAEFEQDKINWLLRIWVQEHEEKVNNLSDTLKDIYTRLDNFGEETQERINSPEYLALVRTTFRSWDQADSEEKRLMLKKLITNAGATKLVPDDLIRLFIKWIDEYHESHFAVIKEIYKHPGITRGEIWDHIHTERPREDSAEADLFKYLIRDLSTGGVIRQSKETNEEGQFLRAVHRTSRGARSTTMESAFEDSKPYVLTELGKKFISYVLNDVVKRID